MSIDSATGLFSADTAVGDYTVTATVGGISGTATVSIIVSVGGGTVTGPPGSFDATIATTPATTYQTIEGFGVAHRLPDDPHMIGAPVGSDPPLVWTTEEQDVVLAKLYHPTTGIGLMRATQIIQDRGTQSVQGGTFDDSGKYGAGHVAFIERLLLLQPNLQYGATTVNQETWLTEAMTNSVQEHADWMMHRLRYWKTAGRELKHYMVVNEHDYNGPFPRSGSFMVSLVKNLRAQMDAEGINTLLVAPDTLSTANGKAVADLIIADATALAATYAFATHLYVYDTTGLTGMKAQAATYSKKLWMTEWFTNANNWALTVHDLLANYDFTAVDYEWGFFGSEDAAQLIAINHTGTTYNGYTLLDHYYLFGQYTKYVRPGYIRISASTAESNMLVTAFKDPTTGKRVIVIKNNSSFASYNVQIDSGASNYRLIRTQISGTTDKLADKGLFAGWAPIVADSVSTLVEQ